MKTVSLELAKQLQEAGVEIETEHFYDHPDRQARKSNFLVKVKSPVPAPTTDELLEWLPEQYKDHHLIMVKFSPTDYLAGYEHYQELPALTPTDALAKLCLWVKENQP